MRIFVIFGLFLLAILLPYCIREAGMYGDDWMPLETESQALNNGISMTISTDNSKNNNNNFGERNKQDD